MFGDFGTALHDRREELLASFQHVAHSQVIMMTIHHSKSIFPSQNSPLPSLAVSRSLVAFGTRTIGVSIEGLSLDFL